MTQIPKHIKDYASNANYYIEAAEKFTYPSHQAVRLLLLTAWENIKIAEEELSGWAQKTLPSEKLYRSHEYKLRKSPLIDNIIVKSTGIAETTTYATDAQFKQLHQICRYGTKTGSKELSKIFKRGWFLDDFERSLVSKIKWEELMVNNVYPSLPNYGKKI